MSWGTVAPQDFMKTETSNSDAQFQGDNSKSNMSNPLLSYWDKETVNNLQTERQRSTRNMCHNIGLFRKYLRAKSPPNMGKTNAHKLEAIKRSPPPPLQLPKTSRTSPQCPSSLDQESLPRIRPDAMSPTLSNNNSSKAQLTIFYSGAIHVYENVPVDKAQMIMLLAGESSLSNSEAMKTPMNHVTTPPLHHSNLQSIWKLQAGS